ncbi:MAG: NAD(P)-dependent oxidoreductase [Microbacterium sp.]
MSKQHILVTGASGYIGRHLVTALLDHGAQVTAVVRRQRAYLIDDRATIVEADVLADALDLSGLSTTVPDAVVHLAWQDGFRHDAPSHIRNLSAHFRFLERVSHWGVNRITVLGTMHEVGYWEGPIDALTPTNPRSLYGIAKDALRRSVFIAIAPQTTVQWLRCFYIYGDDANNQSIFTKLLDADSRGESTLPFTTGKNLYDFIEVDELGQQIATVALRADVSGIINCCSGVPVSLADKVERFIQDKGLSIRLGYGAFPDRAYDSPGVWGDASRIQEIMAEGVPR